MTQKKYYIVTAKCGHVGRDKYIPISFPVIATSKSEAATIVRNKARVKHDHKNAILSVEEVDKEAYDIQQFCNAHDPYLMVRSKHEQNKIMSLIYFRLQNDSHLVTKEKKNKRMSAHYKWKKRLICTQQQIIEAREYC